MEHFVPSFCCLFHRCFELIPTEIGFVNTTSNIVIIVQYCDDHCQRYIGTIYICTVLKQQNLFCFDANSFIMIPELVLNTKLLLHWISLLNYSTYVIYYFAS